MGVGKGKLLEAYAWLAIVFALGLAAATWSNHVRNSLFWKDSYKILRTFGDDCSYAVGVWQGGDTFDAVHQREHRFTQQHMPYRGTPEPPMVPKDGYLFTRCLVDLSKESAATYPWMRLGVVIGTSKIYVNGVPRQFTSGIQESEFPVLPDEIARPLEISLISRNDAPVPNPGLATLAPLAYGDGQSLFRVVDSVGNSFVSTTPKFELGVATSLFLVFALAWLFGIRYRDVSWIIVVTALLACEAYLRIHPEGLTPASAYYHQAICRHGLYVAFGGFLTSFFRVDDRVYQWALPVATLGLAAYFQLFPQDMDYWFGMVQGLPAMFLASLIFGACARRGFVSAKSLSGKRRTHVLTLAVMAGVASFLYFVQGFTVKFTGIWLAPFLNYLCAMTFALFLMGDLVVFHRAYFLEKAARMDEERKMAVVTERLELGRQVQTLLLPAQREGVFGPHAYRFFHEAAQTMAGDWYFCHVRDGVCHLYIGDVVGKGPQAAIVVSAVMKTLRDVTIQGLDLPGVVLALNDSLHGLFHGHVNTTFLGIAIHPDGRALVATHGGCGWIHGTRSGVSVIAKSGNTLGATADVLPQVASLTVRPEDVLLAATDGCIATSRDQKRFAQALAEAQASGRLPAKVVELFTQGSGEDLYDDRTMLVVLPKAA